MIQIKDKEFTTLVDYLLKNYGINLSKKRSLIESRMNNTLNRRGYTNFSDYLEYVYNDKTGEEISTLINLLTTNHTYFNRESLHFDYFKSTVLPWLEANNKDKDLRIWSAGCSSGEEPYTLTMIMNEYFGKKMSLWDTKILATDISMKALNKAQQGIYGSDSISKLPNMLKEKYMTRVDDDKYSINKEIKNNVIFRKFNLMEDQFPFKRKFHVIFCRNVMIYFKQDTKQKLVDKFYQMTENGGYLFIGHSEAIHRDKTSYNYIMPSVYRKI